MSPLRLSLWRKTGIWTNRVFDEYIVDLGDPLPAHLRQSHGNASNPPLKRTYIPPSVASWLEIIGTMCNDLEQDASKPSAAVSEDGAESSSSTASRPPLEKCNLELISAVSYARALAQLHAALKEGGTMLSLANRVLQGLDSQIQARDEHRQTYPPELKDEIEQTRMLLENMLIGDARGPSPSAMVPLALPAAQAPPAYAADSFTGFSPPNPAAS
jgi:hypothetical protein